MLIAPGMVLGRYKIRSSIGEGGMGAVFLAEDTHLERLVALKVLLTGIADDADSVLRFVQEAKAASALNHPNILTIYEIGTVEDSRFIATEFINGKTLREALSRELPNLRDALEIALQVAAALEAAHAVGVVHRDIKPENIMIRDDGLVKVLDFGLAKLIQKDEVIDSEGATLVQVKTVRGALVGTVNYMSPEQARGKEVDTRTDIWSLGTVIYEMLKGRAPFTGETPSDTIAAILKSEPERLGEDVPHELSRILRKTLEKNKDERYQTVKDLLLDLKNLKRELEFASEIEHSHSFEFASSTIFPTSRGSEILTGQHQDALATGSPFSGQSSSVEYLISGIKSHKKLSLGMLAAICVAVLVPIVYFSLFAASSKSINSLAVMPFVTIGDANDTEYISEGLSEALINNLSQLPQLKVIARSSTFEYKDKDMDPQQIAKALGVEAIVTGRLARRGDDLQISVELINAVDKTRMWGESYNRKVSEIQNVQEEIAQTISQKLKLRLSGAQEQRISKTASTNPQAYQFYMNGVFYGRKRGIENVKRAFDYHTQAIALDPDFALAYVELATEYSLMIGSDIIEPNEAKQKARAAVEKALALDQNLAEAHLALARIKHNELDWTGAETSYKRAIELNPNLVLAYNFYSFYLSVLGRHDEALIAIRRAEELDPLSIGLKGTEGSILYAARRYDEAIKELQDCVKLDRDNTFAHAYLGLSYSALGKTDEALKEFQNVVDIQGETTSTSIFVGRTYALSGNREKAISLLEKLTSTRQYVSPGELATLYSALGDKEKAIEALEKAHAGNDLQLQFLKIDPGYDALRKDARFIDLLHRVGFPE